LHVERGTWGKAPEAKAPAVGVIRTLPPHRAETIFRQIQLASKANSGGGSSSLRERNQQFSGVNLSGRLHLRADSFRLTLDEAEGPRRSLEYNDDGQDSFRLLLAHPDGDLILLQQGAKGAFTVVALVGGKPFVAQGESFVAVFRKHRRELETQVLPVLHHA